MFVCPECGASYEQVTRCPADGREAVDRGEDTLLGHAVGPYRIARLLGAGGMGRVYKAVHPGIGSWVAIKVLAREYADRQDLVDRFFGEARAVNLIRHESIVNVLDLSALPDGRPCIVMEYLDGSPLAEVIERHGQLPLGTLARLVGEVLDALAAAHAKGIVHRDLKPDNIFVSRGGRTTVLDFGIAKLLQPELSGAAGPTRTGAMLGTPHYMAPEQAMGRPVDARADLYSVGVILFEAACGQRPFVGESLYELLHNVVEAPPPSPRQLRPDLPEAYEAVILNALAKDPAARVATATALAEALAAAASELPPEAWAPLGVSGSFDAALGHGSASGSAARTPRSAPPPTPNIGLEPTVALRRPPAGSRQPAEPAVVVGSGRRSRLPLVAGAVALVAIAGVAGALLVGRGGGTEAARLGDPAGPATTDAAVAATPVDPVAAVPAPVPVPVPSATPDAGAAPVVASTTTSLLPGSPATVAEAPARPPTGRPSAKPERPVAALPSPASAVTPDDPAADSPAADSPAPASPAPAPTPTAKPGFGPTGWKPEGAFTPARFDSTNFDPSAFFPEALRRARAVHSDAVISSIHLEAVFPDGHVDFSLSKSLRVQWFFYSPSRGKPADHPEGLDFRGDCLFSVSLDSFQGGVAVAASGVLCDQYSRVAHAPRCTLKQVWQRAIKQGAPGGNTVAQINFSSAGWYFRIGDRFSKQISDDC